MSASLAFSPPEHKNMAKYPGPAPGVPITTAYPMIAMAEGTIPTNARFRSRSEA